MRAITYCWNYTLGGGGSGGRIRETGFDTVSIAGRGANPSSAAGTTSGPTANEPPHDPMLGQVCVPSGEPHDPSLACCALHPDGGAGGVSGIAEWERSAAWLEFIPRPQPGAPWTSCAEKLIRVTSKPTIRKRRCMLSIYPAAVQSCHSRRGRRRRNDSVVPTRCRSKRVGDAS